MYQVSTTLGIPVPKVLSWSAVNDNPVESEYIIMEGATGVQLSKVWDEMKLREKFRIVEDLVEMEKKLLSVTFKRWADLDVTLMRIILTFA